MSEIKLTKRGENVRDLGLMLGWMLVLAFVIGAVSMVGLSLAYLISAPR